MATYSYDNLPVEMCKTLEFSWVQERDPTHTDAMYSKYTIRVQGFLTTGTGTFNPVGSTASVINTIKARLEAPRKSMSYKIGTETLVSIPDYRMDAKLGPEPLPATVSEVNTGVFLVQCGCIVRVVDCDHPCTVQGGLAAAGIVGAAGLSPILSLRWTQTETFDENWYSQLVTDGKLIVRSDLLQSADNFRPLATPPLLPDYLRKVSRYTLSPDGIELAFHFEDVEMDRLPPTPATKAKGSYTVQTDRSGYKRIGTVRLSLEGQKGTSRKALLVKAVAMGYSKLSADRRQVDETGRVINIMWGKFVEDLFEPKVDIEMGSMMTNINTSGFVKSKLRLPPEVIGPALALPFTLLPGGVAAFPSLSDFFTGAATPGGTAGGAGGIAASRAPVAIDAGAKEFADQFTSSIMPSVGTQTYGLADGQFGIAPPDRKRLAGLLTAMFRDPCLCTTPENAYTRFRNLNNPPSNSRNPDIVNPEETKTDPPAGGSAAGSAIIMVGPRRSDPSDLIGSSGDIGDAGEAGPNGSIMADTAPYDAYELTHEFIKDTGLVQMPGTGVGTNGSVGVVVSTSGGSLRMLTAWVACRTGAPPELPTFESTDTNIVPLSAVVVTKDVVPSPDGASLVYMVSGYYTHAILDPVGFQITAPVAPQFGDLVRQGAALAASFWTDRAIWPAADGVTGGIQAAGNADPFEDGGALTQYDPVVLPAFDQLQVGVGVFEQGGSAVGQVGSVSSTNSPPSNNDYYSENFGGTGLGSPDSQYFYNSPVG